MLAQKLALPKKDMTRWTVDMSVLEYYILICIKCKLKNHHTDIRNTLNICQCMQGIFAKLVLNKIYVITGTN